MLIATYNVNSINARLENLGAFLQKNGPDIMLLQEIKCTFESFPFFELRSLGYDARVLGQKSYNGVAVLSRTPIKVVCEGLPGFADDNARYLETEIKVEEEVYRVASLYLPNGNPPYNDPDDKTKFDYKLRWMEALYERAKALLALRQKVILGGDFNVIMTPHDVYDPALFLNNALYREEVKQRFKAIEYLGYYDAFRSLHPQENGYTFWDYAGSSLAADFGMRIDYLLLSPNAADRLESCMVDKEPRQGVKPSDHTVLKAVLR